MWQARSLSGIGQGQTESLDRREYRYEANANSGKTHRAHGISLEKPRALALLIKET
jgi:hypothetical protein